MKKILNRIFIEGLSGMAQGLFATLIIGTILCQIAQLVGGVPGNYINMVGTMAKAITGAGIGKISGDTACYGVSSSYRNDRSICKPVIGGWCDYRRNGKL